MLPLHQAWLFGGLCRASPVPFRGSSFTADEYPSAATPQRCVVLLLGPWDYGHSPFVHFNNAPRGALRHCVPREIDASPASADSSDGSLPRVSASGRRCKTSRSLTPSRVRRTVRRWRRRGKERPAVGGEGQLPRRGLDRANLVKGLGVPQLEHVLVGTGQVPAVGAAPADVPLGASGPPRPWLTLVVLLRAATQPTSAR